MRRFLLLPVSLLAVAACSDSLPVQTSDTPALSVSSAATSRYAVLLRGSSAQFTAKITSLGGTLDFLHDRAGVAIVSGMTDAAAAALESSGRAELVIEDFEHQAVPRAVNRQFEMLSTEHSIDAASQANPATAAWFPRQWHMRAIGANVAWAKGRTGSPNVDVAILDSGIDPTYIDLLTLVDVSRAAAFVDTKGKDPLNPTDDQLIEKFFPGVPLWRDLNGHGTHVASTVSSRSIGNAGVTSRVTLIPVKVLGASGSGSFTGILQGILYAADKGADVINASVGAIFYRRGEGDFTRLLDRVTKYARDAGVTTVVAAGNEAAPLHPSTNALYSAFCSTKNVICVSATGPHTALGADGKANVNGPNFLPSVDLFAVYSNYGQQHVDVAAPGGNYAVNEKGELVSAVAVWAACSKTSLDLIEPTVPEGSPPETKPDPPYYQKSVCAQLPQFTFTLGSLGTSMASPHVAGLAALLVETYGRDPNAIREVILQTADDLGKSGTDDAYGRGRINIPRALGL
ncbi:MAG TPA: S8 family serine peptidase [Gemmatimonadaceae bacterium]|nr:S8 family serine peptidase [Gemmatimonadaceae bacterium]